jgi:hypothetical protein
VRSYDNEEECKAIMKNYLEERLTNEAVVTRNGFKVKYLDYSAGTYRIDGKLE